MKKLGPGAAIRGGFRRNRAPSSIKFMRKVAKQRAEKEAKEKADGRTKNH